MSIPLRDISSVLCGDNTLAAPSTTTTALSPQMEPVSLDERKEVHMGSLGLGTALAVAYDLYNDNVTGACGCGATVGGCPIGSTTTASTVTTGFVSPQVASQFYAAAAAVANVPYNQLHGFVSFSPIKTQHTVNLHSFNLPAAAITNPITAVAYNRLLPGSMEEQQESSFSSVSGLNTQTTSSDDIKLTAEDVLNGGSISYSWNNRPIDAYLTPISIGGSGSSSTIAYIRPAHLPSNRAIISSSPSPPSSSPDSTLLPFSCVASSISSTSAANQQTCLLPVAMHNGNSSHKATFTSFPPSSISSLEQTRTMITAQNIGNYNNASSGFFHPLQCPDEITGDHNSAVSSVAAHHHVNSIPPSTFSAVSKTTSNATSPSNSILVKFFNDVPVSEHCSAMASDNFATATKTDAVFSAEDSQYEITEEEMRDIDATLTGNPDVMASRQWKYYIETNEWTRATCALMACLFTRDQMANSTVLGRGGSQRARLPSNLVAYVVNTIRKRFDKPAAAIRARMAQKCKDERRFGRVVVNGTNDTSNDVVSSPVAALTAKPSSSSSSRKARKRPTTATSNGRSKSAKSFNVVADDSRSPSVDFTTTYQPTTFNDDGGSSATDSNQLPPLALSPLATDSDADLYALNVAPSDEHGSTSASSTSSSTTLLQNPFAVDLYSQQQHQRTLSMMLMTGGVAVDTDLLRSASPYPFVRQETPHPSPFRSVLSSSNATAPVLSPSTSSIIG